MSQAYGWNEEVTNGERELLADGTRCAFEVTKLEKSRREIKGVMCNEAKLHIVLMDCDNPEAQPISRTEDLPLHRDFDWKLWAFFKSIGQRASGDSKAFKPDWTKVSGSTGFCIVGIREYKNKKGELCKAQEIKKWLEPDCEESAAF